MYATRHNPFMYFHSVTNSSDCASHVEQSPERSDQPLHHRQLQLHHPSLCDDGHDAPCVDGRPGGLVSVDVFLQKWIPINQASAAYKQNGLILINFDESGAASTSFDAKGNINVVETGNSIRTRVPTPTSLVTPTNPPCRSTISWVM